MNELAIKTVGLPAESEFNLLQVISRNAALSGLYAGVGSEQKIFMILLAARELGIPPMQAINGGIWNIQGKIEISARLMTSMIRRAGHSIKFIEHDDTICVLEGKRADSGDVCRVSFSMQDAAKAGLANRAVWKMYAQDMLFSRAISRLSRRLFPDVIGTAYVEGEIRDAKSEIVETIHIDADSDIENAVDEQQVLDEFLSDFPHDQHIEIQTYLEKYATHWKKSVSKSILDYADRQKFVKEFAMWKAKVEKNRAKETIAAQM